MTFKKLLGAYSFPKFFLTCGKLLLHKVVFLFFLVISKLNKEEERSSS